MHVSLFYRPVSTALGWTSSPDPATRPRLSATATFHGMCPGSSVLADSGLHRLMFPHCNQIQHEPQHACRPPARLYAQAGCLPALSQARTQRTLLTVGLPSLSLTVSSHRSTPGSLMSV